MTGIIFIPADILDLIQELLLFHTWTKRMYITSEDGISCTTPYQEALLEYEDNKYIPNCRLFLVIEP